MALEASPERTLLLDARPLEGSTGARGVGRYVASLLEGLSRASARWRLARLVRRAPPGPDLLWSRLLGPRWVREAGAHLYHATFLAPLRVPRGLPWVSTIHDLIPLRHPRAFTWRQRTAFRRSLVWNARATRVIAVSPFTADLARQTLGAPPAALRVVPPPVEVEAIEAAVSQGEGDSLVEGPFLLHTSGFDPLKGVSELLLPAFARVAAERPGLRLVMTGPGGSWRARAERVAARLGLAERALFPGLVSDTRRAALLRDASALVVSSREEGFGIPAIEGLAAGLPVVVGPAEATRWAVASQGHLAGDDSPEGLASAILEALEAPGRGDSSAAESRRRHARRFSPLEVARQVLEVYEEALA